MSLSGLSEESAEKKVQALTLCFSRETLLIVQNLGLSDEERKNVAAIISAIKKYIDGPHINESVERRNCRRCTQQQGETFDDYLLVVLRELVKTCNFCSSSVRYWGRHCNYNNIYYKVAICMSECLKYNIDINCIRQNRFIILLTLV